MADLRAAIAGLRAVRAKMTPGPWRTSRKQAWTVRCGGVGLLTDGVTVADCHTADGGRANANACGIVATHNAADALLDALDRIAAVMDADESDPIVTIDEIRAILDGARGGDAP